LYDPLENEETVIPVAMKGLQVLGVSSPGAEFMDGAILADDSLFAVAVSFSQLLFEPS
jgi:hypothetical protein